ncbi:hypothetical protein [uncultured Aquimarina sp.]|uniref:hypothetical protein n=1 Tax=uncultured Aquimarina sp. TaxID=575652 RepID=UPI0026175B12|nr:hypothetical protein [uncultured Aquimarina sp.]
MKIKLLIGFVLLPILTFAQEKWTYQSDSLYKINKVKSRKWYNGKKLKATTFYNRDGKMVKFQHEPFVGGEQRTIYFEYDKNKRLVKQVDTTRNGKPDEKTLKKFKSLGLDLSSKAKLAKPELEISEFKIEYKDGELKKLTKYYPDGSLNLVDHFENNGKIQTREWYRDGKKYRETTTEYINDFYKEKYYGWEIRSNSKRREWNYTYEYTFKDNGQVNQFIRFDNNVQKETTEFTYDENGLLTQVKYYTTENFEYEYYK